MKDYYNEYRSARGKQTRRFAIGFLVFAVASGSFNLFAPSGFQKVNPLAISILTKINSRGEFHEAPGLTAFGLFPILISMNPSPGFRRAGGAPTFLPACFATPGLAQSLALLCFSLTCRALRFATPGLATLRVPFL